MTQADSKVYPTPPSLIKTLLAGFDVITNHIWLILFSISLDVLLWFGPQIRIKSIIQSMLDWMAASADLQTPEIADLMDVNREAMLLIAVGMGVNPDERDALGGTALMAAAETGNAKIVEELLRIGSDINAQNNAGKTALVIAVENGNDEVANLLRQHSAEDL